MVAHQTLVLSDYHTAIVDDDCVTVTIGCAV